MTHAAPTPFIAIACGGTGGHLFPGLAVAEQLTRRGAQVALLISPKDVDQQAVKDARGVEVITLPAVALQHGKRLAFLRGCWRSWRASRTIFKARRPDAVLAMGGFTSAPPVLAARALGAKTFLHESNTIPGRANRWLARVVDQAFVGFPQAAARLRVREALVTGTPVRGSFRAEMERRSPIRRDGRGQPNQAGSETGAPIVLVMGGSQGASGINDLILATLPLIAERARHWRWLHLTGPNDCGKVQAAYAKHGLSAEVHPFLADMSSAMLEATAAVSRAGASSLAEIAAVRLPSLLIPFPAAADDHQRCNAHALAETGAARVLDQKSATPATLFETLRALVEDPDTRRTMQRALETWDAPQAAEGIAAAILNALAQSSRSPAPSTPGTSSSNPPTARALSFGIWCLMLLGSLEVGTGNFAQ